MCLQGFKQQALAVSTDPEHRFELALQLGELKIAYQLAVEAEVSKRESERVQGPVSIYPMPLQNTSSRSAVLYMFALNRKMLKQTCQHTGI